MAGQTFCRATPPSGTGESAAPRFCPIVRCTSCSPTPRPCSRAQSWNGPGSTSKSAVRAKPARSGTVTELARFKGGAWRARARSSAGARRWGSARPGGSSRGPSGKQPSVTHSATPSRSTALRNAPTNSHARRRSPPVHSSSSQCASTPRARSPKRYWRGTQKLPPPVGYWATKAEPTKTGSPMAQGRSTVVARIAMTRPPDPVGAGPLEALRTLLDSASRLLGELTDDPLLARWTKVFAQIPAADREAIVAILEREMQARVTAGAVGDLTGLSLRPNPRARPYTRVLTDHPQPNPQRALDAALRAIQITHNAVAPMDSEWQAIARDALGQAGAARRPGRGHFSPRP